MAGLYEGGNEPTGSLKAIYNNGTNITKSTISQSFISNYPRGVVPPPTGRGLEFAEMATGAERAFVALEIHSTNSVITVQRHFRARFDNDPRDAKIIRRWYNQLATTDACVKENLLVGLTWSTFVIPRNLMSSVHFPTPRCTAPSFFLEPTVSGHSYLDMLGQWLMPQLESDSAHFMYQQDGAPLHFHNEVRTFLNDRLPNRWIGRAGRDDMQILSRPPRSPDLTPCDFYLWGYVKDSVFVPPLPENLPDLRTSIINAIAAIDMDTLSRVWDELDYRLDVCRDTSGAHIDHLLVGAETDQEEEKELAGSQVEKKLPSEGCTGTNGKRKKSSGQKKILDDRRH
ncbi:hypothetical protein ANN_13330 [Periplaneta americana]|uniref:DUF4817 domain-containing protein n=1 Tax=Periplaneta americana TaxID=6978 RepID=A0ABQ8TK44_PERAM|nr:hypothetical protein ANN_13330 [Periplaneta americana]